MLTRESVMSVYNSQQIPLDGATWSDMITTVNCHSSQKRGGPFYRRCTVDDSCVRAAREKGKDYGDATER